MKIFDEITSYVKDIFSQWLAYLFLIPNAYSFVDIWFDYQLSDLSQAIAIGSAALFFVFSNYSVYRKQAQKIRDLESSQVDYKISHEIIHDDFSEEWKRLEEQKEKVQRVNHSLDGKVQKMIIPNFPTRDWGRYEKELQEFEDKLTEYIEFQKDVVKIYLTLKNVGATSDEDINVVTKAAQGCSFINLMENEKPEMPREPQVLPFDTERVFMSSNKGEKIRSIRHYLNQEIEVEVVRLRVGEEVAILIDPIHCKLNSDEGVMEIEIKSKHLKAPISKEIVLNKDETSDA